MENFSLRNLALVLLVSAVILSIIWSLHDTGAFEPIGAIISNLVSILLLLSEKK